MGLYHLFFRDDWLGPFSIMCLIVNKMIGTGIFITPALVLALVQSKVGALLIWFAGVLYSYASIYVYLEYGLAWPFNGGEFLYIIKVFPVPPLVLTCAFAWAFVTLSTSAGNGLNFGRFIVPSKTADPDEWLSKFIGCWAVVAISVLHYRCRDIGVLANNTLACLKIFFVLFLVLAGLVGVCIHASNGPRLGTADWAKNTSSDATQVTASSVVRALLLVLFSFQGWENANYVTAEISNDFELRRQVLKKGAFRAVGVVSTLYFFFNLFLFLLLEYADIINVAQQTSSVAAKYAAVIFNPKDIDTVSEAIYICIALSAAGNLVGVIFTNSRVKREIAEYGVIPFAKFFSKNSNYGRTDENDSVGTPTGALILHGLITCITIAATPFYPSSEFSVRTDGVSFIINLYTYSHSVIGIFLGFGALRIRKRIREYQTEDADDPDRSYPRNWDYSMMNPSFFRWILAAFIVLVNVFIVGGAFAELHSPTTHIQTWMLPSIVLPIYLLGALVGLYILATRVPAGTHGPDDPGDFYFRGSRGRQRGQFVDYNDRKWIIRFPESVDRDSDNVAERSRQRVWPSFQSWAVFTNRLRQNGEKEAAERLLAPQNEFAQTQQQRAPEVRQNTNVEMVPLRPMAREDGFLTRHGTMP